MPTPSVLLERRDAMLLITINRPHVKNAVDLSVARGLADAFDTLESDPRLGIAILTGADNTFCAGMDLKAFGEGRPPVMGNGGFAGITRRPPTKPVIAAVEGYALAGGCEIALVCDLIVAARNAHFGLPEVRRGLVAAAGGLVRLPRRIPRQVAMEYALTGALLPATRAYELGLVNRLVEPAESLAAAIDLASSIVANAPLAVRATKRIIKEGLDDTEDGAFALQESISAPVMASSDAREGAAAFVEKRQPVWQAL